MSELAQENTAEFIELSSRSERALMSKSNEPGNSAFTIGTLAFLAMRRTESVSGITAESTINTIAIASA